MITDPTALFLFRTHKRVVRRGGLAEPLRSERAYELMKSLCNRATSLTNAYYHRSRPSEAKYLHVAFVNSTKLGAFAFSMTPYRFIALQHGIIDLIWLFNALLSMPFVLPRIGNAALERPPRRLDIRNRRRSDLSTFRKPLDPARRQYAYDLFLAAFDFLSAHEFAHLFHGHTDFLAARSCNDPLIRHALENDADHFGVNSSFSGVLNDAGDSRGNDPLFPHKYAVGVTQFALYVLFRLPWLDDSTEWDINYPEKTNLKHPPIPVRALGLASTLIARIQYDFPDRQPQRVLERVVRRAVIEAESALRLTMNETPNEPDGFRASGRPETLAYCERIDATWAAIKPELQRYSIVNLP